MKVRKKIILITLCFFIVIVLVITGAFIRLALRSARINDDYTDILADPKYEKAVSTDGVELVRQEYTCGYAVIEMYTGWSGILVTEEQLISEHDGKVVTSTSKSFAREMNRKLPNSVTSVHSGLKNTEMIDLVYTSLESGKPVPFVWAALLEDEWTLHYSLITAMDIAEDNLTVANPYGYMENISLDEFLDRTRFDAYEDMSFIIKMAFAFGVFDLNTLFVVS